MLDLWGKMVPNLPNEALKVRYDATLGRLQDMNETEKNKAIALSERKNGRNDRFNPGTLPSNCN